MFRLARICSHWYKCVQISGSLHKAVLYKNTFPFTLLLPSHGFVLQMANIFATSHFQTRLDPVSCFVLVLEFFVIMVQVILLFCPSFRVVIMDQVEMGAIWPVITKYESMTMQHFNNKQWYITQTLILDIWDPPFIENKKNSIRQKYFRCTLWFVSIISTRSSKRGQLDQTQPLTW